MKSQFSFMNYKIDRFSYSTRHNVDVVQQSNISELTNVHFTIGIREPTFYSKTNIYLGGVNCGLYLYENGIEPKAENKDKAIFWIEAGIAGAFQFEEGFKPDIKSDLVKAQIPAILFPYLRGTITTFLANAGFGSIILPLINMNAVAQDALKDKQIKIIE